ncbi:Regulator of chromosome condensation, RCC1 [Dillenia turbinata]|uniref:Regulator of chromosome condensation, RCC1 n=1 Tax=Dillenia turbinata TaxID=194707 RepID=A0AAN8Z5R5_9MAGN
MIGPMQALSAVIWNASASDYAGSSGDWCMKELLMILDEFFIAEKRFLQKENLTHDYDTKYWSLYLKCVKAAYDFASGELLSLTKEKYDLMGKLRLVKHYILLEQESGLVYAAGLNDFGQLGVSDDKSYTTEPLHVCKLNKEVKQISAGYHHSCAITGLQLSPVSPYSKHGAMRQCHVAEGSCPTIFFLNFTFGVDHTWEPGATLWPHMPRSVLEQSSTRLGNVM